MRVLPVLFYSYVLVERYEMIVPRTIFGGVLWSIKLDQFSQAFSAFYRLVGLSAISANTQYVSHRLGRNNTQLLYYIEK